MPRCPEAMPITVTRRHKGKQHGALPPRNGSDKHTKPHFGLHSSGSLHCASYDCQLPAPKPTVSLQSSLITCAFSWLLPLAAPLLAVSRLPLPSASLQLSLLLGLWPRFKMEDGTKCHTKGKTKCCQDDSLLAEEAGHKIKQKSGLQTALSLANLWAFAKSPWLGWN